MIQLLLGVLLLMQGCAVILGQTKVGCMKWHQNGDDVCCEACHPGNRLVIKCGPRPKELCTPCELNTYSNSFDYRCARCTQCVGALYEVAKCTATTDTKCGCKDGLCGDDTCTFCIPKCGKGQEPTDKYSCRPCPNGTFNDQIHSKCKPWSSKCPLPDQRIMFHGDAFRDIECAVVSSDPVKNPTQPDSTDNSLSLTIYVIGMILAAFVLILIAIIMLIINIRRKKKIPGEKMQKKTPIIMTPTDDPRTLIAIECSFHEAQQEQGSSTESLASKESSQQLIA